MKDKVKDVEATPSKRLYQSIIADYDLNRSICELIDNSLDVWVKNGKNGNVSINISLDIDQQSIFVSDNVGGLKLDDLKYIIGPGQTTNEKGDETIGIFGVGSKRAVVALAQDIKISTRYKGEKTYLIEYDDRWLEDEDTWFLPAYQINDIPEGETKIELSKLRLKIIDKDVDDLRKHLGITYAFYIRNYSITLNLNGVQIQPAFFDNWSYPPEYLPTEHKSTLVSDIDFSKIDVEILSGLTTISSPSYGDYGVYVYCNERLICRALKDPNVGFTQGLVGAPHPKKSLARVIVLLKGEAYLMPWNSSKSGLNYNNKIFLALQNFIIERMKFWADLSSRLEGKWPEEVFKFNNGKILVETVDDIETSRIYSPPLPKTRKNYFEIAKDLNKIIIDDKPWVRVISDGMLSSEMIYRSKKLIEKKVITLILLDSTLELAFKEYLANEMTGNNYYDNKRLGEAFRTRKTLLDEIYKHLGVNENEKLYKVFKKLNYYHDMRNKLIHQRAMVDIKDEGIEEFSNSIKKVLGIMFGMKFE